MKTTIVACATGIVRAGISVVRLSGPDTKKIVETLTGKKVQKPRYAYHRCIINPETKHNIDQSLILFFQGPQSFTGEDLAEFHTHGSPLIVDQVISACISLGATVARPGEFSERAFLNGKIDLIQAESIADLIASRTAIQAQAALSSLGGALSERVNSLQARLTAIRVQVEASIDFAEQDISTDGMETTRDEIKKVLQNTEQLIQDVHRAIHSQEGIRVAIVGAPNAGKSSLLNYLAQQERAIVTDIPGTTRDIIDVKITHNGHYLEVLDTAGIRESTDPVERIGVQKTREAIKVAGIVWLLFDTTRSTEQDIIDQVKEIKKATSGQLIVVGNKIDCGVPMQTVSVDEYVSAKSGQNISALLDYTVKKSGVETYSPFSARERHLLILEAFKAQLKNSLHQESHMDCLAEDLRAAQEALSEMTGAVHSEALLDAVFRSFCLGK